MTELTTLIVDQLTDWTDSKLAVSAGAIDQLQTPLKKAEEESLRNAVPKRRMEFTAGRTAARRSLAALGHENCTIPVSTNRSPIWPASVVGSISHTDKYCVAIAAQRSDYWALGVDIEAEVSLDKRMTDMIFSPSEKLSNSSFLHRPILYFSIKEAVYKAYSPATGEFLNFDDISLKFHESNNEFTAFVSDRVAAPPWGSYELIGKYATLNNHVLSFIGVAEAN